MLRRASPGRTKRWASAGRLAGRAVDQIDAEAWLWSLLDAGLIRIRERLGRRGDWEPYQWQLTSDGEQVALAGAERLDVTEWLARADPPGQHQLESIREWLGRHGTSADPTAVRLVVAIGDALRAGRVPRGRLLSIRVGAHTKAVRVEDYREAVEEALGARLEDVVLLHGLSVLAHGAFAFSIAGRAMDGRWSVPWLALTEETLASLEDLRLDGGRILTVENLVPFEEEVRAGLPKDTVAVFVAGFPHRRIKEFLLMLCEAGATHVDHWGDLDLGGLRILRHLAEELPVPVRPWRMEPELLERLPTLPLTPADRDGLQAWVEDPGAPARRLAEALLRTDRKAEQEGWLLLRPAAPGQETDSEV